MSVSAGDVAADFALRDVGGHRHRAADFAGRWLLMVFHRHLG